MYIIDASIFLEVELKQERNEECKQFLSKVTRGEIKAIISDFAIDSIILIIERHRGNWKEIKKFLESLSLFSGLSIYKVTLIDKIKATEHMKNLGLDFDDSVVLQSAFSNNIKEIVSFDKDFDGIKEIRRLEPGDVL